MWSGSIIWFRCNIKTSLGNSCWHFWNLRDLLRNKLCFRKYFLLYAILKRDQNWRLRAEEGNDGAAGGPDVSGGSAPGDSSLVSERLFLELSTNLRVISQCPDNVGRPCSCWKCLLVLSQFWHYAKEGSRHEIWMLVRKNHKWLTVW